MQRLPPKIYHNPVFVHGQDILFFPVACLHNLILLFQNLIRFFANLIHIALCQIFRVKNNFYFIHNIHPFNGTLSVLFDFILSCQIENVMSFFIVYITLPQSFSNTHTHPYAPGNRSGSVLSSLFQTSCSYIFSQSHVPRQ